MRSYLKEIIFSIVAVLVMALAIISFFKAMKRGQVNEREDIYRIIPEDVNALLVVNRPGVFDRMILRNRPVFNAFASEVPVEFLSFIRQNSRLQLMVLSFHPQGVVCYLQADSKLVRSLDELLQRGDKTFSPVKQTKGGLDYYYYPFAENRFLGCFTHNGVWVGSFSRKLLENTAGMIRKNALSIPFEMNTLLRSFDSNAPLNIVFPTKGMGLEILQDNSVVWRIEDEWLGADLFIGEDGFCSFGSLPYQPGISSALYQAMGDTIARKVNQMYPQLLLSFQIDKEEDLVYYTGCTPMP